MCEASCTNLKAFSFNWNCFVLYSAFENFTYCYLLTLFLGWNNQTKFYIYDKKYWITDTML